MSIAGDPTGGSGVPPSTTLPEAFRQFVRNDGRQVAYVLARRRESKRMTRAEVGLHAGRYATPLLELGVLPGERVAIALNDAEAFLGAFWGVVVAGGVPVPLAPIRMSGGREQGVDRFVNMLVKARPAAAYVDDAMVGHVAGCAVVRPDERAIQVDTLPATEPRPSDPAFIQFTSGSSSAPRGCVHTHEGVLANVGEAQRQLDISHPMTGVNWCPPFHDLGLAGFALLPVTTGWLTAVNQATADFLVNPLSWLRLVHEYRAEITSTSNAGMALLVRRLRRGVPDDLDLSSVRHVFDGSEPIDPELVRSFVQLLLPTGLSPASIHPVYGLAENVAFVASSPGGLRTDIVARAALEEERQAVAADPETEEAVELPALGGSGPVVELRIVDAGGRPVPARTVGAVEVRSVCTMLGYFGDTEATSEVMDGDWLVTGDLGYLLDGELYLVGRAKDVLIVGGRNYFAFDVERAASAVDGGLAGAVVAFAVQRAGSEAVVVVAEGKARLAESLCLDIRQACVRQVGLVLNDVVVVRRGSLPRTTSGKVRRQLTRSLYETDRLDRVGDPDMPRLADAAD